jgi:hypothetical protein
MKQRSLLVLALALVPLGSTRALRADPPSPATSASVAWALPSASAGSPTAELARKWSELAATRLKDSNQERAALIKGVGARLQDPRVQAELALHTKRVAELQRLEFLARNARTGSQRDKLLGRIAKLVELEARRHRRHLARLVPLPSASAAAVSTAEVPR